MFFCAPGAWSLHRCLGCGAGYLDPRPTPATIGLAYADYYTHAEAPEAAASPTSRRARRRALRNGYLNARYGYRFEPADPRGAQTLGAMERAGAERMVRGLTRPDGRARLLDVGCGNGAFLGTMKAAGWEVVGLEPDRRAAEIARSAGFDVVAGPLDPGTFPEASFDAVTLFHVIEHIHDPPALLAACRRVLRPGGTLSIATPNLDSLGHTRFGPHWRGLEAPRHLVLFTPASLRAALVHAQFVGTPTLVPSYQARGMFRASTQIARGEDPNASARLPVLLDWWVKQLAARANARVRREPDLAEEVVLLVPA